MSARFFLSIHKPGKIDYTEKFKSLADASQAPEIPQPPGATIPAATTLKNDEQILCPICGAVMVRRTATRGKNAGNEFYGCSNFPKCRSIIAIQ
ncbi:MAG: hypothetical protein GXX89_06790 [Clostridiales bacterium]|jgi:predicted RNA-binding Zn-ribbon protein involved in translation (DUF1610 family)|nr:hypothetical protein [Clostridiales bacterium]